MLSRILTTKYIYTSSYGPCTYSRIVPFTVWSLEWGCLGNGRK